MGVAHLTDIRGKLPGKLTVIQEFAALFTGPSPCPGMKLVDGHRERLRIKLRAFLHPGSIPPGIGGKIYRDGSSIRTFFTGKTIGIALEKCKACGGFDLILIKLPFFQLRNKELKDPIFLQLPHRKDSSVPSVEITNQAHTHRVWSPDSKVHALRAVHRDPVGAQVIIGLIADPGLPLLQSLLRNLYIIIIGILHQNHTVILRDLKPIIRDLLSREQSGKEPIFIHRLHRYGQTFPGYGNTFRGWEKCLDQDSAICHRRTQKAVRLALLRVHDPLNPSPIHQIIQFFVHRKHPLKLFDSHCGLP